MCKVEYIFVQSPSIICAVHQFTVSEENARSLLAVKLWYLVYRIAEFRPPKLFPQKIIPKAPINLAT